MTAALPRYVGANTGGALSDGDCVPVELGRPWLKRMRGNRGIPSFQPELFDVVSEHEYPIEPNGISKRRFEGSE